MDCVSQGELGSSAYLDAVFSRARRQRQPVSGAFDLTYRCNFRCKHCYAGHLVGQKRSQAGELETGEVLHLLSEAAEAGCLLLLLSGGEPLLRDDFIEIYTAARRLGMIVSVFTNASLIRQEHLDAFGEYPPHQIEVSLYGASAAIHERVTGAPGSYRRVRRGVERLLERGVGVTLKTMILRDNLAEVAAMAAFARDLGLRFRVDPLVTPRLNGDQSPLDQRVDPQQAVDTEFGADVFGPDVAVYVERKKAEIGSGATPAGRLYRCGAGLAAFHLDPQGSMHPCLMSPAIAYNAVSMGFDGAWKAVTAAVDEATFEGAGRCTDCPDIVLCGYCPGLFVLEKASPSRPPDYACRLGENRLRAIGLKRPEVVHVGQG